MNNVKIISGTSHPILAQQISYKLGLPLCDCIIEKFSNTEIRIEILESIRNKDIFIIQTGSYNTEENNSINDYLMETLITIDACKRSMAKTINLVMPCYPYARQDKKGGPREPITARLVANILEGAGIDRIIVMDLHAPQIQGFFNIPVDNLYSMPLVIKYFKENIFKNKTLQQIQNEYVLAAPDAGAIKRTLKFGKSMTLNTIFIHKDRSYKISNTINTMIIVGNPKKIKNKTVIILDDMCDTGGTLAKCCSLLIENGAKDVICVVTHGILSGPAAERINSCKQMSKMIVSNTLPQIKNQKLITKLEVFDISNLMKEVIKRIITGNSISALFQ